MRSAINIIKSLIEFLPKKDISIGYRLLEKRDFQSLRDLVGSAVFKVHRSLKSSSPNIEYLTINTDKLKSLMIELDNYVLQLEGTSNIDNYEFNNNITDNII